MIVILISPDELAEAEASGAITDENRPDVSIHEFKQLLDIFPARNQPLTASLLAKDGFE
jgi:hypothetical protein